MTTLRLILAYANRLSFVAFFALLAVLLFQKSAAMGIVLAAAAIGLALIMLNRKFARETKAGKSRPLGNPLVDVMAVAGGCVALLYGNASPTFEIITAAIMLTAIDFLFWLTIYLQNPKPQNA